MKVLVIGATGFLGKTIVEAFLKRSDEVWGSYRNSKINLPKKCHPIKIGEIESLDDDFDAIVFAAGNFSLSEKELIEINVHLTKRVSDHFRTAKLVFISSVAVYGNHMDRVVEDSVYNSPSLYGQSKIAGEAVVQTHNRYAILRLTYLYGAGMPPVSFLPIIVNKAKDEKKITLFGRGERLQDYLHVEDAANLCILASIYVENGIFLGATGHSVSNLEVAKEIQVFIPDLFIDFQGKDTSPWFQFDPTNTNERLGWHCKHELRNTLKEMIG